MEEFDKILKEAYQSVEDSLALEDKGWITLSGSAVSSGVSDAERKLSIAKARIYAAKDPLCRQAIRLWTDYAFGPGMDWTVKDDRARTVLENFWYAPENKGLFSPRGQRLSSDKTLIDGEIFFALFLGPQGKATLRRIDPLEITDIITSPDDLEDVRYYKRVWTDTSGAPRTRYYRSPNNLKGEPVIDAMGATVQTNEEAIVYHLAINTIGQRGNSLLLPVVDWIKLYRDFLASRVAIMLALAKFAWKVKVKGGAAAVTAAKAVYQDQQPAAGSIAVENMVADMQPVKTDSGAANAYQDGRQIKLQVAAGTGFPEQYFGDISIGNLATAKTVELPVAKMIQSYQAVWGGVYDDICDMVFEHNGIPWDNRYIDRDFPPITPANESAMATNISMLAPAFPELMGTRDVLQQALISIGVH
ncbi:MAG: hypothetical protein PHQ37_07955, partial [Methanocellales archaeon]|nr:hypothetical protein [Methanocellales archaeon]